MTPLLRELAPMPTFGSASSKKNVLPTLGGRTSNRTTHHSAPDDDSVGLVHESSTELYAAGCRALVGAIPESVGINLRTHELAIPILLEKKILAALRRVSAVSSHRDSGI